MRKLPVILRTACQCVIVVGLCQALTETAIHNFAQANEPSIGVIVPLTGPFAVIGGQILGGLTAAMNAAGQKRVKLTIVDDRAQLPNTVDSFRRLIMIDRAPLIVGFPTSGAVTVVAGAAKESSIPIIHLSAFYDPKLSDHPGMIFGLVPDAESLIDATAEFAKDHLQIRSAVILFGISQQFESLAHRLNSALNKIGIRDVKMQRISASDDLTKLANSFQSSDLIILGSTLPPPQLTQARVITIDPMPNLSSFARGSGFLISAPQTKPLDAENIALERIGPQQFVGLRAYGFALGEVATQAFEKGKGDPKGISAALQEQEFETTVFGRVRFTRKTGFSDLKPVLSRYEDGRLMLLAACTRSCSD